MMHGPLGRYSQAVAAILATLIIVTALALRVIGAIVGSGVASSPFVDNLALIAMGAVFGAAASTSVNGGKIEAAHRRLDQISAPAADHLAKHPDEQAIGGYPERP